MGMSPRHGPRKYEPPTAYLVALTVDEMTLTLAEIEQIIGAPLPKSAWVTSVWVNSGRGRVGRWRGRGWRGNSRR
jgi:hypothetical protein